MAKQRFTVEEYNDIWTVYLGDMPIGRALTKKDANDFAEALNGILGNDLRDRLLQSITDAIEECFDG